MFSILVHCLVLFLAYTLIRTVIVTPSDDILVELVTLPPSIIDNVIGTLDPMADDTMPTMVTPVAKPSEPKDPSAPLITLDRSIKIEEIDIQGSPLIEVDQFLNRSEAGRAMLNKKFGGSQSEKTEAAVLAALDYLKSRQNADGSWTQEKGHKALGVTGLALLTFLAHGESPSTLEYGRTVEQAMRWLLKQQNEQGEFSKNTYAHAIATYAMAESYAMTRIPILREPLDKAVAIIIDGLVVDKTKRVGSMVSVPGIDERGAKEVSYARLEYAYNKETRMDTSVLGWNAQALKAAHMAGNKNPKLTTAIAQVKNGLMVAQNRTTGKFMYSESQPQGSDSMTGVGVLCLQLLGFGSSPEAKAGLRSL